MEIWKTKQSVQHVRPFFVLTFYFGEIEFFFFFNINEYQGQRIPNFIIFQNLYHLVSRKSKAVRIFQKVDSKNVYIMNGFWSRRKRKQKKIDTLKFWSW